MKLFVSVAAVVLLGSGAQAKINLVQNGGFESSSYKVNSEFGGIKGHGYTPSQGVTDWMGGAGSDLQFYFIGGTQNSVSAIDHYGDKKAYFYSSFSTLSPNGGNFIALDGDSHAHGMVSQTINGLTPGKQYELTFDWAATQLANRSGKTTEQFQVSFGKSTQFTPLLNTPSKGFTGWFTDKMSFTAGSTSEVLSFLSVGTPKGLPPIAVLDGVSLTAVPEPATWAMILAGFGIVGIASRRRSRALTA